jgi:hypothetical protein
MLKARMLLSAVAVGVAVPAVAHAQIPQVPQPSQVTQAVQVPQAPQLPPVPQVPKVPEVPVPVPDLPEPPPVPAPPPAPKLPAPSLPATGVGGGGGASSGGGGGSAPSGGGSSAAPSGGGGTSSASSGGGSSTGGDTTTRRSHVEGSDGAGESRTPVQRRRAERRLQRAVARLGGCLDELAYAQQRVLELRAGVGAGPPRTRRGVARVLDIRVKRVWRLERRGLRNARSVARSDGCGSAAASGGTSALASGPSRPDGTGPGSGSDAPETSAGPAAPDGVGKAPDGAETELTAVRGTSPESAPPDFANGGSRLESPTGTSLWVAVGLMLLAALAGFATPSLRGRLREGPPARAGHL